jgi:hypothetical protein
MFWTRSSKPSDRHENTEHHYGMTVLWLYARVCSVLLFRVNPDYRYSKSVEETIRAESRKNDTPQSSTRKKNNSLFCSASSNTGLIFTEETKQRD